MTSILSSLIMSNISTKSDSFDVKEGINEKGWWRCSSGLETQSVINRIQVQQKLRFLLPKKVSSCCWQKQDDLFEEKAWQPEITEWLQEESRNQHVWLRNERHCSDAHKKRRHIFSKPKESVCLTNAWKTRHERHVHLDSYIQCPIICVSSSSLFAVFERNPCLWSNVFSIFCMMLCYSTRLSLRACCSLRDNTWRWDDGQENVVTCVETRLTVLWTTTRIYMLVRQTRYSSQCRLLCVMLGITKAWKRWGG